MASVMKMKASILVIASLLVIVHGISDRTLFKDVPLELRCPACELTIKNLHNLLLRKTGTLESRIKNSIAVACDEERFMSTEYKVSTMARVCRHITKEHESELRKEIYEHYQHPTRSTYMDFSQHMCLGILKFCAGVSHKHHQHVEGDTVMHFDSETHGFTVMPGRNIKMPTPVAENHHEEL